MFKQVVGTVDDPLVVLSLVDYRAFEGYLGATRKSLPYIYDSLIELSCHNRSLQTSPLLPVTIFLHLNVCIIPIPNDDTTNHQYR